MKKKIVNDNTLTKEQRKASRKEQMRSIFKVLSIWKKYLPLFLVSVVLMFAMVVISIISPNIMGELTDTIQAGAATKSIDMKEIMRISILLIVLYGITFVSSIVSAIIMTRISMKFTKELRTMIDKKIDRLPIAFFDKSSIGDIMSRLTNDVDQIAQSLQQTLATMIHSITLLLGVLIMMFVTQWSMALTCLATLPLMFLIMLFILKCANPLFIKRAQLLGDLEGVSEENYNGQKITKLFNAEKKMNEKFEDVNQNLGRTLFKSECFGGLMNPLMNFLSYFTYALVCLVGGLLMNSNAAGVTIGTITSFLIYVNLFQSPLSQISQSLNNLQMASASSVRVMAFLEEKEMDMEEDKTRKLIVDGKENVKGRVVFDHVNFSYDSSREIIHDFSAVVEPGMKVAIVGPTGAGKTTLVNLLMRFYEINSGKITIDGVDIKDMPKSEIRDLFAMVLQDTWVFDGTLRENLAYNTPNLTDDDLYKAIKDAHLVHFVRALSGKLDYHITDGSSISGGQKQLITIARAMLKNAPLLILDEATSNVDTRTEEKIQESMDRLSKGKTSFVIAHRLSTIKNSDLILVLNDGNIVEQGTHESLMKQNGFYASLYNSQFALTE